MSPSPVRVWADLATAGAGTVLPPVRAARRMSTTAGPAPSDVVYTENKLSLRHFEPSTDVRRDVPVLLVYAFINRPSILDFRPGRSVVRQFLDHGFDVYLLDWGEPSRLDAHLDLGDFVTRYLANCVDVVGERTGVEAPHLLGYCTGATLAVAFAALAPDRVRTLGLLAPLLNFDVDGGVFDRWPGDGRYEPRHVVESVGNVPGEWLAAGFALVDPVEYYLGRYLRLVEHLDDEAYVSRFLGRLRWGLDSVDVAGELYREFLVELSRENQLLEGRLALRGTTVDLANLTMPVLLVLGTDDQFVPAAAGLPLLERIPSTDTEVVEFPTDHVGLSTGDRAHADLWPRVCEWFARRSGRPERE